MKKVFKSVKKAAKNSRKHLQNEITDIRCWNVEKYTAFFYSMQKNYDILCMNISYCGQQTFFAVFCSVLYMQEIFIRVHELVKVIFQFIYQRVSVVLTHHNPTCTTSKHEVLASITVLYSRLNLPWYLTPTLLVQI